MTGSEIRESFLRYFEGKGHTRVSSSALIPKDDPSLLFTNAGMVQFKNSFLGLEDRGYRRAVTSQKCVRAGGKHNDLENVGVTARHHTFFEMLGNFSFGDYFKDEAIAWAWEYLTEVIGLDKERLWITIYRDDEEAFQIWHDKIGLPVERIVRMGEASNFWMMGDTGPCGPCSEIIYDQGKGTGCGLDSCNIECDCDRYLEIWNIVFMQFNRDSAGQLIPLPKPNIDTGMGLERLAAVVQDRKSNYDSDVFQDIIGFISRLSGRSYKQDEEADISMRVIADHVRAVTFLIGDGILPSNEGRGYVLRRILRRAARHGKILGLNKPFLNEVCQAVIAVMKVAYPDLADKEAYIRKVVLNEEQRFIETLDSGLKILAEEVDILRRAGKNIIPGEIVFKLYDTHGFPTDLTADIVRKDGFAIDMEGFELAMEAQRVRARESWKGSGEETVAENYQLLSGQGIGAAFVGYEGVTEASARVLAILKKGQPVQALNAGEAGEIITGETPFYGEKGGQVGDRGVIAGDGGAFIFAVSDTKRPLEDVITHIGTVQSGTVQVGNGALLKVDVENRRAIEANHSATHILQAAIKTVLGDHVKQSGSLVNAERLRFDFTHFSRIEEADLRRIETLANDFIRGNFPVSTCVLPIAEAVQTGATAVFDEKYGDVVRVVAMGEISKELCGGTHASRTGDIGFIKITHESSIAAGVRRIEAVTGRAAIEYVGKLTDELKSAANLLKSGAFEVADRLEKTLQRQRDLEKEIAALKGKMAAQDSTDLLDQAMDINGVRVLAAVVEAPDPKALRDLGDKLRDQLGSGIILLGSQSNGKAMLLCLVTSDLTGRYQAGKIIKELAPLVGGSGGGRSDLAQAGGPNPGNLAQAVARVREII
ncbi:MAG: alanine--tRNA ligase [Deltaproteobacteria bacterium]|nr:alanine--tRNA ligase [Deltaproteobacteria bacterium]